MLAFMYPLFLSDFNKISVFWKYIWKILKYQISWKSFQWGPSYSMRTEEQADMTEVIVAFRTFRTRLKSKDI
jgi:hypothetical protein